MNLFQKKPWRWVACFIVSLLCTVLFASLPSLWQSASATSNGNSFESPAFGPVDANQTQVYSLNSSFEEVAASHLEPNFY